MSHLCRQHLAFLAPRAIAIEGLEPRLLFSHAVAPPPTGHAPGNPVDLTSLTAPTRSAAQKTLTVLPFKAIKVKGTFDPQADTIARYTGAAGFVVNAAVASPGAHLVSTVVPPLFDASTGSETAGALKLEIIQTINGADEVRSTTQLKVVAPKWASASPGAATLAALHAVRAYTTAALANPSAAAHANGLNTQLNQLDALIADVTAITSGSTSQVDYGSVNNAPASLNADALRLSDQLAAAAGFKTTGGAKVHNKSILLSKEKPAASGPSAATLAGYATFGATAIALAAFGSGVAAGLITFGAAAEGFSVVSTILGATLGGSLIVAGGTAGAAGYLTNRDPVKQEAAKLFTSGLEALKKESLNALAGTTGEVNGRISDLFGFVRDAVELGRALNEGGGTQNDVNATGSFGGQLINSAGTSADIVIDLADNAGTLSGAFRIYIDGTPAPARSIAGTRTGRHLDFTTTIVSSGVSTSHYTAEISEDGQSIAGTNDSGSTFSVAKITPAG